MISTIIVYYPYSERYIYANYKTDTQKDTIILPVITIKFEV